MSCYVTQSSVKQLFHVTCVMSSDKELVCLSFIAEMKSNKDTRYKRLNCRPDYILERICRF